jgi:multiple sugar transport system ATP-binding protein
MSSIRFENVKKSFRDVTVIKELNLTVNDGEFFTFVGPSGCGKSTILNMIAGLEDVTEGLILFDGTAVNHLSPKDRDVAMVFQSYALYPHMNVFDNLAFPLRMKKKGRSTIEDEVKRVASLLGLEDLLGRKPKELSGGQRQRVALGRAIIRKPKVFLMDEPLSNLDARLRIETRAELKKLHQELKITTIYVTHDQAEAMSLSDRVAVIDEGEIQQCETPVEVYSRPANIFVAGFIGSPPMNFIPAAVRKTEPLEIDCRGIILSPGLKDVRNEEMIIGIRPEDIIVSDAIAGNGKEVIVSVVEPAGPFNWVDFVWNKVKMKGMAKIETPLKTGYSAFMKFPLDKVIVFDAASGKRLQ